MRRLAGLVLALLGLLLLWAGRSLPGLGARDTPVLTRLTPWFMEEATAATGAQNAVTAILADVRGFDTQGEVAVIFAAGLAAWLILGRRPA